ncbi:hypothetical protein [Fictibacillus nanhaiensis]|uniref:hypothetical protein n=1 Tax=Fictibacillus nanhaiensis TaxID=742169 RepID=UPI003C230C1C
MSFLSEISYRLSENDVSMSEKKRSWSETKSDLSERVTNKITRTVNALVSYQIACTIKISLFSIWKYAILVALRKLLPLL